MGLGQNLLDTPTLRSGAYVSPSVTAHAATGIVATDTAVLLQAIADTPPGGWLSLPNNGDTPYMIDQPLVINQAMRITGGGVTELYGSQSTAFNTCNVPSTSPYLLGTVIRQVAAATNILELTAAGEAIYLSDFGMTFDSVIRWTDTGHGIFSRPSSYGTGYDNGVMGCRWDNLTVFGHDGNHYGYWITNPLYNTLTHLHAFGGGTLFVESNTSAGVNYGNMLISHLFGQVVQAGSAHGIRLAETKGTLNLIRFSRPQVGVNGLTDVLPGTTPPTNSQLMFNADANVPWISTASADFESSVGSGTQYPISPSYGGGIDAGGPDSLINNNNWGVAGDGIGRAGGGGSYGIDINGGKWVYTNGPANWMIREINDLTAGSFNYGYQYDGKRIYHLPRLQIDLPSGLVAVAGAGAGTAPPAPVTTGCNDARGTITFGTGSAPTAGAQVGVTFQTSFNNAPTVVISPGNATTAALGLYVTAVGTDGFTVSAQNAPAANQADTSYVCSYLVIG